MRAYLNYAKSRSQINSAHRQFLVDRERLLASKLQRWLMQPYEKYPYIPLPMLRRRKARRHRLGPGEEFNDIATQAFQIDVLENPEIGVEDDAAEDFHYDIFDCDDWM